MPRYQRVPNHPGAPDLERLRAALDAARHPFLLLGGSGWTARAVERIAAFAQAFELPVGTACGGWNASTSAIPTPPARSAGA